MSHYQKYTSHQWHITANQTLPKTTTLFNIFLLDVNFDKSTIGLHFLLIFSILTKFLEDQKLIAMSSIKYLNFKFL